MELIHFEHSASTVCSDDTGESYKMFDLTKKGYLVNRTELTVRIISVPK